MEQAGKKTLNPGARSKLQRLRDYKAGHKGSKGDPITPHSRQVRSQSRFRFRDQVEMLSTNMGWLTQELAEIQLEHRHATGH
jgi:hypothetical protein